MLKLYLDDVRDAPEGYTLYRPADLSVFYMMVPSADVISLDHDLGLDPLGVEYPNGYQVLCVLEGWLHTGKWLPVVLPEFQIHSANPVGIVNMERVIKSMRRFYDAQQQEEN